jgi:hypothetical protein
MVGCLQLLPLWHSDAAWKEPSTSSMKAKPRKPKWPDFEARRKKSFPNGVKGKPASKIVDEGRGKY